MNQEWGFSVNPKLKYTTPKQFYIYVSRQLEEWQMSETDLVDRLEPYQEILEITPSLLRSLVRELAP